MEMKRVGHIGSLAAAAVAVGVLFAAPSASAESTDGVHDDATDGTAQLVPRAPVEPDAGVSLDRHRIGAAIGSSSTIATPASSGGAQRCGSAYHAGSPLGDGEYSEGAILDASGISCKQALALVRPRYRALYRDNRVGAGRSFRIGAFACKSYLDGPNLLKRCLAQHRRFDFI
jgi:hypothetical protein